MNTGTIVAHGSWSWAGVRSPSLRGGSTPELALLFLRWCMHDYFASVFPRRDRDLGRVCAVPHAPHGPGRATVSSWGVDGFLMENVRLSNSPFWTITVRGSRNLVFRNVSIHTDGCGYSEAPNTDGFNVQGENILIQNCRVRNGDDCVPVFPPSNNVTVDGLSCECGNGVVPVIWPDLSLPGRGGIISNVLFK